MVMLSSFCGDNQESIVGEMVFDISSLKVKQTVEAGILQV